MRRLLFGGAFAAAVLGGVGDAIFPARLAGGSPRFLEPAPRPADGYRPTKYSATKRAYRTAAVRKRRKAQRAARKAERRGRK